MIWLFSETNHNSEFDSIFNFSEIGLAKPDKRIYEYVLEKLGVGAGEVLYIDDSDGNVDVARGGGLRSWV